METKWPYEFPGVHWVDNREEDAVLDVLRNGSMFRYYGIGEPDYQGDHKKPKYVDLLESKSRQFYGCDFVLALNSGTGALLTCMRALDIGPGCEVILPAFMWVATVGAIVQADAIPVFCEIDESFNMDAADLEKKITDKTKLILPVHMAGVPCDMDKIMAIADKHSIPVLEDCAQCNGGSFNGKRVGTYGKMGIYSLQLNKNMTCGEGGILVTDDERLYTRAFAAHDMGLIRVDGRLVAPEEYAYMWGAGRRMNEMCGAVASVQLDKLPDILNSMRNSKYRIRKELSEIPSLQLRAIPDESGDSGPFLIIILETEQLAEKMIANIKENGLQNAFRLVDYGLHIYYNIPSLVNKVPLSSAGNPWTLPDNIDSNYNYAKGACPKSDDLFSRSLIIPVPSCLTEEQEQFAIKLIQKAVTL